MDPFFDEGLPKPFLQLAEEVLNNDHYLFQLPDFSNTPYATLGQALNKMLQIIINNENQIQELTIQLQEKSDQLETQRRMDIDRIQNLQKMFAGASHDLRQPLQAMTIFLASLKENATQEQAPMLHKLEQVVDNLNSLFTDLLDISKLESRMQRIPKKVIPIRPLLAKIHDEFEALANDKQIEFRLYQRDLEVYSNPNMLERIIRNMISNAIRYTRTGGVLIGSRKRGNSTWIEVWDTGRGIPGEKMNDIFNEFVQIKEDDSESNKGVGLGLFIVKRLAQLLDHTIIVKSKIHRGTMFRIVVPTNLNYSTSFSSLASSSLPGNTMALNNGPLPSETNKPNILLVDDDNEVRESVKSLLRAWQMEVTDFCCIEELERHLATVSDPQYYDLLISDFQLSDTETGLDAIRVSRSKLRNNLPAIIVTGADDPAILESIRKSSVPMLKKPVKPAKLRTLINFVSSKT